MLVSVLTDKWDESHYPERPRGKGNWLFTLGNVVCDFGNFSYNGLYSEAKKAAVKEARKLGLSTVPYEQFWVMALNQDNRILGVYKAEEGTVDRAQVRPRKILTFLLGLNASACIIAHNHPGGRAEYSPQDVGLTKALQKLFEEVDIRILDHLLLCPTSNGQKYVSMRERGLM